MDSGRDKKIRFVVGGEIKDRGGDEHLYRVVVPHGTNGSLLVLGEAFTRY